MKYLIRSEALKVKPSKLYFAENAKSAKTLEELSNDSNPNVRDYVARNPNCPVEILKKLSQDSDSYVRDCANESLNRIRSAQSQAF